MSRPNLIFVLVDQLRMHSCGYGGDPRAKTLGRPGPTIDDIFLQGMGHTWLWPDGFEWRGLRTKQFIYAIERADGCEYLFDNQNDPLQRYNLANDRRYTREKEIAKERMWAKMAELNDEFRTCSWYCNWTENRIVLRGAKGPRKGPGLSARREG